MPSSILERSPRCSGLSHTQTHRGHDFITLRWLNTVLAVCECMSFAKSWQEKGCSSQVETWQVKNILMKDFY